MRFHFSLKKRLFGRKAGSVLEFTILFIFMLSAMLVIREYVMRGVMGGWKASGASFAFGRQQDARNFGLLGAVHGTLECFTYQGVWYSNECFLANCTDFDNPCTIPKVDDGLSTECLACVQTPAFGCENPACVDLPDIPGLPPIDGTWQTTDWSTCSSSCGPGVEFREVTCSATFCNPLTEPRSIRYCNLGPCP